MKTMYEKGFEAGFEAAAKRINKEIFAAMPQIVRIHDICKTEYAHNQLTIYYKDGSVHRIQSTQIN